MIDACRIRAYSVAPCSTPRCQAVVIPQTGFYKPWRADKMRRRGLPEDSCGNFSSYLLEGRYLCHSHAGKRALELITDNSGACPATGAAP